MEGDIRSINHIVKSIRSIKDNKFLDNVTSAVNEYQAKGWKVEVTYRQSDKYMSALIIAREK